jgi:hypothetical protein
VRWYLRYKLSYRDLVEMLVERGLAIAHMIIICWVQRFVPGVEKRWNRYARLPTIFLKTPRQEIKRYMFHPSRQIMHVPCIITTRNRQETMLICDGGGYQISTGREYCHVAVTISAR